ncbi:YcgJ family protein [Yersinia similis]|uniref:YcgJ family protein n=1 Tax=Yersinia similis TaxID=367190 RepID=UPI0011A74B97|nr:YcgJ family protein [Yersinia similis]
MKKVLFLTALLGVSTSTFAATIFEPSEGVVCDKKSNFCVDNQGISMGWTKEYLGSDAEEKLSKETGRSGDIHLWEYTLSNGVYCDSHAKQCYTDRYFPRTKEKQEKKYTAKIFGTAK